MVPISVFTLICAFGLTELCYEGRDGAVATYVSGRKRVRTFRWTAHGQTRIDLSKSALTELGLDVRGPLALKIPPTLTRWEPAST